MCAASCQIILAMRLTFKYRIHSERFEIKMELAGQTGQIFSNKKTRLGGVAHFLFQAVQTEITVPFGQHFHCNLICYLFASTSAFTWVF